MAIFGIYELNPAFPPTTFGADVARYSIDRWTVDASGGVPDITLITTQLGPLTSYAIARRLEIEQGGIGPYPSNDRAKVMIGLASLTMGDTETATFMQGGAFYGVFTGAQMRDIFNQIRAHTETGFVKLRDVLQQIISGAITTRQQIDEALL
jgi:hypothetical protein